MEENGMEVEYESADVSVDIGTDKSKDGAVLVTDNESGVSN